MNKTVVKVLGLGVLAIGGVVFTMFVKDEKEALSKKGFESWADEKIKSVRSEDTEKLFKNFEESKKAYEDDQKRIDAKIDEEVNRWKVENHIDEKLLDAKKTHDKAIEDYKKSVDYDAQLEKALKKRDELIEEWKEESGYNNDIQSLEIDASDAEKDYARGKQALKLISNDDVRKGSEKLLKEEYEKRKDHIKKERAELYEKHKKATSKAQEWYDSVVDPITEKFRLEKKVQDDVYKSKTEPIYASIDERRTAVADYIRCNKSEVTTRIENRYHALMKDVNDVNKVENDIKEQYIKDAEKHNVNILYDNLRKKGWSKWSIYLFEGVLPIGAGLWFLYVGLKFTRWGVLNIKAIHDVSSVK